MLNLMSSRLYCAHDVCSVLYGEEMMDFSNAPNANVNEPVNPGQTLWKWKTVEDHLHASLR